MKSEKPKVGRLPEMDRYQVLLLLQEVANRGTRDTLSQENQTAYDEAVKWGLITEPDIEGQR